MSESGIVAKFGLERGDVVGEMGYDDDVDDTMRLAIEDVIDGELVDEDADEVVDAILLWWREDDGDLTDALVDALTLLADDGTVLLATPKTGRTGYVEASDITEAGRTAGLSQITNLGSADGWSITRLSRARTVRAKR